MHTVISYTVEIGFIPQDPIKDLASKMNENGNKSCNVLYIIDIWQYFTCYYNAEAIPSDRGA